MITTTTTTTDAIAGCCLGRPAEDSRGLTLTSTGVRKINAPVRGPRPLFQRRCMLLHPQIIGVDIFQGRKIPPTTSCSLVTKEAVTGGLFKK